ncbi:MAG: HAMP domain-containing histidine kinase [Acidobacteriota bacterium]|nr:HAMP domain-containing histidine kinase [Acidobacteriota bacterium]
MKLPFLRFELARTRLAFSGALLSALFLSLLALGARSSVRSKTFDDIDEELYTLAVALGSSFELEGLEESKRDTLKAGLEVNAFEFRLANHSAILFKGDTPVAASGNLMKTKLPGGITPFRDRPEVPFTAVEPYSGQNRACRFLVTHLQGKAQGATLVLFRWIGPNLRSLARLDRALAGFVVLGFLGTAAILAGVVTRALKTVEEVTATAEAVEATDLSRRVRVLAGGEEFRRLAAVINSLLERLDLAFRAQKRLIADAAHELKTPTAVLVGEAQEALRAEATPQERRESIETIERVARGLAREVDALLLLARGDAAAPTRSAVLDLGALAEEAVEATEPLGGPRSVRCTFRRVAPAWVHGDRAGLLRVAANLVSNAVLYTAAGTVVEVSAGSDGREAFVEVADRGPGVSPEERERIFDRFVRLDPARVRNPEGAGLGLAIVEQVVRAHDGRIEVESRPGGGAIFRAILPAAAPETRADAPAALAG